MRTGVEFLAIGLSSLVLAGLWAGQNRVRLDPVQLPWKGLAGRHLLLVDARTTEEYERGHLDGAISLPGRLRPNIPPELRQGGVAVYGLPSRFGDIVNVAEALAETRDQPVFIVIDAPLPP
ncbi:MAG: hypothetical protein J0I12_01320 [Candidatus Eremiobacteraeota bacterium]|nr:hypothetical protein [Candidatus Eremiobacteraeota bacterium]